LIIIILGFLFKRETNEWEENIKTLTNKDLVIEFMSSERGYYFLEMAMVNN